MDLSQPRGNSINDGINKEEFYVQYSHFDDATNMVHAMGKGCLMAKIDIQHAFRLLPVKQSQWRLLGIQWLGQFYVNTRLPFGLWSAPAIFNKFADLVCWIIQEITNNPNITHYSDDYFIVNSQDLQETEKELSTVKQIFQHLHIPIATEKIEGPSTTSNHHHLSRNTN